MYKAALEFSLLQASKVKEAIGNPCVSQKFLLRGCRHPSVGIAMRHGQEMSLWPCSREALICTAVSEADYYFNNIVTGHHLVQALYTVYNQGKAKVVSRQLISQASLACSFTRKACYVVGQFLQHVAFLLKEHARLT